MNNYYLEQIFDCANNCQDGSKILLRQIYLINQYFQIGTASIVHLRECVQKCLMTYNSCGWSAFFISWEEPYISGYARKLSSSQPQFISLCLNGVRVYQSFLADHPSPDMVVPLPFPEFHNFAVALYGDIFRDCPLALISMEEADSGNTIAFHLLHKAMCAEEFDQAPFQGDSATRCSPQ